MEYSVDKLAKLSGVSARTLRYYDQLGLLVPKRISSNGYRVYGGEEIGRLQQILFYRELGVPLEEIGRILTAKDFDAAAALQNHLQALLVRRERIDALICNVEKTLKSMKGDMVMTDKEKFDGFKQKLVDENEATYGKEIREKYGEEAVERSNTKLLGTSRAQYAQLEELSREVNETLKAAFEQGDPAGELAQKACELHKRWLLYYWDQYSKEAHMGLGEMYVSDPRFTAYYDQIAPGLAVFLRDALRVYCAE
jgi:DNA-binding transcriptional MerR regulator